MTKTLSEMMANFTPEEQAEIQAEANQLIAEEITLRELRKAYLANYIQGLGGGLKLVAEFPENKTFIIKGLADLSDES
ncbi:hypothetical protein [Cyanobacterium sp. Dongsha4]|uniref:hypothetical protein n=1 Tax=Cyanobacterium sp. DS4 TaxID=2878255 RepID=UPI002E80C233|nr:hypothetical protein [Cyanobacterium sp. Dongsha4]WVK99453.1 hypothetical protein Dongsha4_12260 [Cyanobacterium sp. Dongsha4]